MYSYQYIALLVFMIVVVALSLIMVLLPILINGRKNDIAQSSTYECGMQSIPQNGLKVSVKFYLLAILFMIFDVEIMLILPWAMSIKYFSIIGFASMMFFMAILYLTLFYEYSSGVLD